MFYVFETSEDRIFVVSKEKVEAMKNDLDDLGEDYNIYETDEVQVEGEGLKPKFYTWTKNIN